MARSRKSKQKDEQFPVNQELYFIRARDHYSVSNSPLLDTKTHKAFLWGIGYIVSETEDSITLVVGGCYHAGEDPLRTEQVDALTFLKSTIVEKRKL